MLLSPGAVIVARRRCVGFVVTTVSDNGHNGMSSISYFHHSKFSYTAIHHYVTPPPLPIPPSNLLFSALKQSNPAFLVLTLWYENLSHPQTPLMKDHSHM